MCNHDDSKLTLTNPLTAGNYKAFEYECVECGEIIIKTENELLRECYEQDNNR